jgi:hypothetical protein
MRRGLPLADPLAAQHARDDGPKRRVDDRSADGEQPGRAAPAPADGVAHEAALPHLRERLLNLPAALAGDPALPLAVDPTARPEVERQNQGHGAENHEERVEEDRRDEHDEQIGSSKSKIAYAATIVPISLSFASTETRLDGSSFETDLGFTFEEEDGKTT